MHCYWLRSLLLLSNGLLLIILAFEFHLLRNVNLTIISKNVIFGFSGSILTVKLTDVETITCFTTEYCMIINAQLRFPMFGIRLLWIGLFPIRVPTLIANGHCLYICREVQRIKILYLWLFIAHSCTSSIGFR